MTDEAYTFVETVKERKSMGYGVFGRKGSRGPKTCILPHEYMSEKERKSMNGEVKTWNLRKAYHWEAFKQMPADVQVMYVNRLIDTYDVSMQSISVTLFGRDKGALHKHLTNIGVISDVPTRRGHPATQKNLDRMMTDLLQEERPLLCESTDKQKKRLASEMLTVPAGTKEEEPTMNPKTTEDEYWGSWDNNSRWDRIKTPGKLADVPKIVPATEDEEEPAAMAEKEENTSLNLRSLSMTLDGDNLMPKLGRLAELLGTPEDYIVTVRKCAPRFNRATGQNIYEGVPFTCELTGFDPAAIEKLVQVFDAETVSVDIRRTDWGDEED